jgi:hypothetical protein
MSASKWLAIASDLPDRNVTYRLMEVCMAAYPDISQNDAQGRAVVLLMRLWAKVSALCTGGNVSAVSDIQLESWAQWTGPRGAFARFVRKQHTTDGVIRDWGEFQGKNDDRLKSDRERKRQPPRADGSSPSPDAPQEIPRKLHGSSADNPLPIRDNSTPTSQHNTSQQQLLKEREDRLRSSFAELWDKYPARDGDSEEEAYAAFEKTITRLGELVLTEIQDGVDRYVSFVALGRVDPEFAMLGKNFFHCKGEQWKKPTWPTKAPPKRSGKPARRDPPNGPGQSGQETGAKRKSVFDVLDELDAAQLSAPVTRPSV